MIHNSLFNIRKKEGLTKDEAFALADKTADSSHEML